MMIPENKVAGKLSSWQRINKSSQMVVFDMMKIFRSTCNHDTIYSNYAGVEISINMTTRNDMMQSKRESVR